MIFSLSVTINVTNLTRPSFVSWFRILSQYGASIIFLLGFGRPTQYPSKFHGECKYPKMMQVLHLNYITLFKWHSTINVKNFAIPPFTWINVFGMIWWAWNKYLKNNSFVSWFTIWLQNDVGIAFLLGFVKAM